MITIKEALMKKMVERGMFPEQAEEVMQLVISKDQDQFMAGRWSENAYSYPENLLNILWVDVKHTAYEWIETNAPMAWFKPMFQYSDAELTKMIADKKRKS